MHIHSLLAGVHFFQSLLGVAGCRPNTSKSKVPEDPRDSEDPKAAHEKLGEIEKKNKKRFGGRVVIGMVDIPRTFNPIFANDVASAAVLFRKIFLAPMKLDERTLEPVNEAQESLEILDGGKTFRIHLRKDLVWGDGVKATAQDLMFTLDVIFDEHVAARVSDYFKDSRGQKPQYQLIDSLTVEMRYEEPKPLFRNALPDLWILPKHLWEKDLQEGNFATSVLTTGTPSEKVVGLGPFKLKSFAADQRVVLERNPHFAFTDEEGRALPYLDELYFLIVPDFNGAVLKLEHGEFDLFHGIPPDQVEYVEKIAKKRGLRFIDGGPNNYNVYLTLNQRPGRNKGGRYYVAPHLQRIFSRVEFRRALSHAIDREALVRNVLMGRGTPLYCLETTANPQWHFDCPTFPYNPEEASRLLDTLGLKDRDGDGIREDETGNRISFSGIAVADNSVRVGAMNMIRDDLKKVGIEMKIDLIAFNYLITTIATSLFELRLGSWGRGQTHPIDILSSLLSSGASHYWNPKQVSPATDWEKRVDELAHCTVSELEESKQKNCYREITQIFGQQQPLTFLHSINIYMVAHGDLGNVVVYPFFNHSHYNAERLYWQTDR